MNDTTNDPILPPGARAAESSSVSSSVSSGVSGSGSNRVSATVASGVPTAVDDTPAVPANVAVPPAAVSAAVIKFRSCRWRRPPEDGTECCGHRDVLPMAGTNSFDAEAWCPDCTYFKLRRTPKKRDESYRY
jgi:hypothetical protein